MRPQIGAGVDAPSAAAMAARSRSLDRKSTRLNSSHLVISYAVFCLKKKKKPQEGRCGLSGSLISNPWLYNEIEPLLAMLDPTYALCHPRFIGTGVVQDRLARASLP